MVGDKKEVYFDKYCQRCEFKDVSESDPNGACWDCLESPANVDSHKPLYFKEASENEESNRKKSNEQRSSK